MKTQLLTILITDSTFRSNIFNGVKKVGNFLKERIFTGTRPDLVRFNLLKPWKFGFENHIGLERINGEDLSGGQKGMSPDQLGFKEPISKVDGGWGSGGGASHDIRMARWRNNGLFQAGADLLLAVDAATSTVPIPGTGRTTALLPGIMVSGGMTLAAPYHLMRGLFL